VSLSAHFDAEQARIAAALPGAGHPAVDAQRRAALARFAASGLPTVKDEDWKYTSLASLERRPWPVADNNVESLPDLATVLAQAVLPESSHRLVFIDGHFAPALSSHTLPAGVRAGSLFSRVAADPQAGLPLDVGQGGALAALDLALSADGLDLELSEGVTVEAPILALFVSVHPERSAFPTLSVRLGRGARAQLVEQHCAAHAGAGLESVLSRISLENDAQLQHTKVQQQGVRMVHLADTEVQLAPGARYESLVLALGGQLGREDLRISLDGPGAHAGLDGLYLARGRAHLDHHTTVLHASPDCTSRQAYRGILDDAGRGVFNGRVVVAKDAQRTDAQQSNANLLLSEAAEIDTKPQLEIHADDVKCSHGATVGQLDPAELFYLRSRGLDEQTARTLVTFAFAARSLSALAPDSPLYAGLRRLLFAHLPGGADLENVTS